MEWSFVSVSLEDILDAVREHLATLPSAMDAFLEERVVASTHYRIEHLGQVAGFTSVYEGGLLTQFSLSGPWIRWGQSIFRDARRLEQVSGAFVPTFDELYLAHALDDYQRLSRQAYFFAFADTTEQPQRAVAQSNALQPMHPGDQAMIQHHTGDFFDRLEERLAAAQIYATLRDGEPVGYGLLEPSVLYEDIASIGMVTRSEWRKQGVGTATIALLLAECRRSGLRPVAGCWYYNHASKRTLERAGMTTSTRLLKIDF